MNTKYRVFLLIAILLLANLLKAQEDNAILDIFVHEGLLPLRDQDVGYNTVREANFVSTDPFAHYTVPQVLKNVQEKIYLTENDVSLKKYGTDAIYSVIEILRNGQADNIDKFTDSLYYDSPGSMKTFFEISKRITGNLEGNELQHSDLIFIHGIKQYYAVLTFKSDFAKANGVLTLYFRLSKNNKFGLAKMVQRPLFRR